MNLNPTAMMLLAAGLCGLTIALLAWGGRAWLAKKFAADVEWIRQTSLRFSPEEIDAQQRTILYYGVLLAFLVTALLFLPNPLIAIGFWVVLLVLPKWLVEMAWNRRRNKIDSQLSLAISTMSNSIRAGLTLVQAMQRLAEQAPEPIRMEFRIMSSRYAYGADLESTIKEAKDRLNLPNFNLFASALLLNREMGGDVADTLHRISLSLDRLKQMKQTVEAHTSEGRTNIKVLMIAPVIMLLMMATIDGPGVAMLFTTPQGYGVLLAAAILTGTGIFFASKITRSEV